MCHASAIGHVKPVGVVDLVVFRKLLCSGRAANERPLGEVDQEAAHPIRVGAKVLRLRVGPN